MTISGRGRQSQKALKFGESVIRGMTRLCREYDGVNLSQGFPDFPAPELIKEAACRAIRDDVNQYAITWGAAPLRTAISAKMEKFYGLQVDPEREITVCCGATEAMISALLAIVDPGDEVIVFAPFYENYGPDAIICEAVPRYVELKAPDWSFAVEELAAAFNEKTRAIIINTPHNPTGKVFDRSELETIAELCMRHDVIAITDEIYEHILYDGAEHIPLASLPGMAERTITINGASKSFSVTGWRVGWLIVPKEMVKDLTAILQNLVISAPTLSQVAALACFEEECLEELKANVEIFRKRRDLMVAGLKEIGFKIPAFPQGAFYIFADVSSFTDDSFSFAFEILEKAGVAITPGRDFGYNKTERFVPWPPRGRGGWAWCGSGSPPPRSATR